MNVNNTIKVDVATTVKIPMEVIIANAEQVFSCTIGRRARVTFIAAVIKNVIDIEIMLEETEYVVMVKIVVVEVVT